MKFSSHFLSYHPNQLKNQSHIEQRIKKVLIKFKFKFNIYKRIIKLTTRDGIIYLQPTKGIYFFVCQKRKLFRIVW